MSQNHAAATINKYDVGTGAAPLGSNGAPSGIYNSSIPLGQLPFAIDLSGMAGAYWLGSGVQAVFCAVLLFVISFPLSVTVGPLVTRFRQNKILLGAGVGFFVWMAHLFGLRLGAKVFVDGVALAELMMRKREQFGAALADVALPAAYLFIGIAAVFSFQHGLAGVKFLGEYDPVFQHLDSLIFRANVSHISHAALAYLPGWTANLLEMFYYSLFMQIGGVLVITALAESRKCAIRYVATLLVGYYCALVIFFFFPTMGPFSLCQTHLSAYPHSLATFATQETILVKARLLWSHNLVAEVRPVNVADYYIGFPCMHIALPIIAIWSLRKWRAMWLIMTSVDVLLVVSIVLLECCGDVSTVDCNLRRPSLDGHSGHQPRNEYLVAEN